MKKRRLKCKLKAADTHPEPALVQKLTSTKTFTPFEGMGGGPHANTPLSMHSEMMAIHSALSASGTSASTALSCQKPCSKLSGGSKRKARLRRDALKTYVNAVCQAALAHSAAMQYESQSQVQERRSACAPPQPDQPQPWAVPMRQQCVRCASVQG
jgi:hypothetical protein